MTFDVDEFLDSYERPTKQVPVCPRAGLLLEHAQLEADILAARQGSLAAPADLLARLEQIEAEIEESVKVFTLTARTYREWSDLMAAHPPTREQQKDGMAANTVTFEPAAVAACASDPVMTDQQAIRMRDTLPPSEWRALVDAVVRLHQERVASPKSSLRSVIRLMNGEFSTMPADEGSLAASSSVGNDGP